jgi:hypothetical protein
MDCGKLLLGLHERAPDATREAEKYAKYQGKKERALANVVLSVDPSLLYLLGEPENHVAVWEKLASQFQCKTSWSSGGDSMPPSYTRVGQCNSTSRR